MTSIKITVDRIQPGLHIRLPVSWKDHPFLLNSFKIKSQDQVDIIRHLGIKHVYINPLQSDAQPLPANEAMENVEQETALELAKKKMWQEKQTRIEKLNAYRRRVNKCEKEFERSLSQLRSVMSKIRSRPLDAVKEATVMVDEVVDKLLADNNVTLHLMNGKSKFQDIYFHSLNVAVIAMMIAKSKGMKAEAIKEIAFGALFHDMGKVRVPAAIVNKKSPLTAPEENYLKLHTKYGLELTEKIEDFPSSAKRIICQHHEYLDGSGYPDGLKGEQIDPYAQIVALANAYDNLCHPRIESEQKIPFSALSHLYKKCKHLYNNENLNILIKFMGVYPPGTVVQLSNEMVGMVISVNAQNILYPNVLLYDSNVPRNQAPILDLADSELKIVSAILPNKLPEKVREYLNPRTRISYYFENDA
ncbi:putative HD-GYP domain-containing protein [Vibrio nigripulchritudo SO65]|uniref:HD-GYP domain-containing protein n=1 Tax=Vibrio nigripulchritudo TaxID=28173 RepID=UPI0003B241C4|nr:HD-GYP domain-containing protein [Vibrio nigripulchritudo]CCN37375.1 putative HD-GYP domain-containing protein [Vibrio nigripulchritudo AM115]CCN42219.1 putative HD-GYP domain-containing protein [Vibrio nigripulchritudo FTn2]CCN65116.1 putative HD-GYP domain-containing protein [Vibrio nigripulchritudo POn4]CCN75865.1 putative HD-GYP domain-containing protein [Vibrio nigripulchritudo SO65]BDU35961.1 HD family phosphohydrolase [Vibrio nigripulchritudo]